MVFPPVQARLSRSGGGWPRKAENKAQLRPAGAGALPELGNTILGYCCAASIFQLWLHPNFKLFGKSFQTEIL